jgi:hypothetical protein
LSDLGARHSEKDVRAYVAHLGSNSDDGPLAFDLLGCRNVREGATALLSAVIASPATENLLSMFYRAFYFGWRLTGSGKGLNIQVAAQTFEMSGVNSKSLGRRVD